jgi:hypothetical protein
MAEAAAQEGLDPTFLSQRYMVNATRETTSRPRIFRISNPYQIHIGDLKAFRG